MIQDIMVDLETVNNKPTSGILSIGACRVNWDADLADTPFYMAVQVQTSLDLGLTQSADTMAWWAKQSEEARAVFTDPNAVSVQDALTCFAMYLKSFGKVRLWGNGSDFDNAILINAYDRMGVDAPWDFWNNRCFRTVKSVHGDRLPKMARRGTHHNALHDAIHQAELLLKLKSVVRE